jgi:hypothetical protein
LPVDVDSFLAPENIASNWALNISDELCFNLLDALVVNAIPSG